MLQERTVPLHLPAFRVINVQSESNRVKRVTYCPAGKCSRSQGRPQPDWKAIHEQLQQHRHLTLQLVWEEYRHRLSSVFCLSAHFEVGLSRKQLAESMTNLRIVINYQHPFRHGWDSKVEVNPDNVVQAIKMGVGCGTDEVMLG